MTEYTIVYFPVQGRAEYIRLLLADQGAKWKDETVSFQEWKEGNCDNLKKQAVFGQLPKFSDGDFDLYESNAIHRYLARKYGLYGKSDKEAALIDMMNDGVEDMRVKFGYFYHYEYDTGKEKYIASLPNQFRPFEGILANNPSGFLVGDQISFADYSLFHIISIHQVFAPDCLSSFPHLQDYVAMMDSRPKIKAYKETEAYKSRPAFPKR